MKLKKRLSQFVFRLSMLAFPACLAFSSCSDTVDDSNLYTFTGELAATYLEKTPQYSSYSYILKKAKMSDKSKSSIHDLLSARGHYTCFAPTNEAIQLYLDSVYQTQGYDITQIPDSTAEYIAKNSIIDNENEEAYQTRDFEGTSIENKTLADRYITLDYETEGSKATIILNSNSRIIYPDAEVENGVIHGIDHVLSPSNAYLPTLLAQTPSTRIFSKLLEVTGWDLQMLKFRDVEYEKQEQQSYDDGVSPLKHNTGYTAFVEDDQLFLDKGWITELPIIENNEFTNWPTIFEQIKSKLQMFAENEGDFEGKYVNTSDDPKDANNIVNQFVSYHLLPARIVYDKLVVHFVEMGYAYKTPSVKSINCHEYYVTMGDRRRLLKFTDGKETGGVRINRYSTYDKDSYDELSVPRAGVLVKEPNKDVDNNALNGCFYLIDDILLYDKDVPGVVLNERMRYDITSLFPELMTNDIRRPYSGWKSVYLPSGYLADVEYDDEKKYLYYPQYFTNYQGDEHNIRGNYDMIMKLPPVPYTGTYELRWCIPIFPNRGMMQVYFGTDKSNLPAIGLPLDLRMEASNPLIGWEADTEDEEYNATIDKQMRNHGYMKPPAHDGVGASGNQVTSSMRDVTSFQRIRKILWTGDVKANETYYVRMKTVLDNPNTMLVLDFMEWCPKQIYNNPAKPEDKW